MFQSTHSWDNDASGSFVFKTGIMGAGKSQTLISDYGFLLYSGKYGRVNEPSGITVFNSSVATGLYADAVVRSRTGMFLSCIPYDVSFSFLEYFQWLDDFPEKRVFLVDEAQFLTSVQVQELARLVEVSGIDIVCYGLKTDFRSDFFEGSEALLRFAHRIETLRSVECWCGRSAVANARIVGGRVMKDGPTVLAGGDDSYVPLCFSHYEEGALESV